MKGRVRVSLEFVALVVTSLGKNYVTPSDLSNVLGISTRSAGKVLRALEVRGYVVRYSNRAYRVIARGGRPEATS